MKDVKNHIKLGLALVFVLALGTFGFWTIEDGWSLLDSLYMTVITITTIGFGEIHQLSDAGRMFTIALIFMGLGLAASFIAQVGRAIVESGIRGIYGKRKMKDRVAKISDHYVICGYGRIGSAICLKLHEMGTEFVVIESDETRLRMHRTGAISSCRAMRPATARCFPEAFGARRARCCASTTTRPM